MCNDFSKEEAESPETMRQEEESNLTMSTAEPLSENDDEEGDGDYNPLHDSYNPLHDSFLR